MKKITMLGNFRESYCSESDYLWTMREKLGMEVIPLQETEATGEQVEEAASSSDAFFWVSTHGWPTPGKSMKKVLDNLRTKGIPSFGFHLDLWLGLERQRELEEHDYWQTEYFFTVDKLMADYMNERDELPKAFWIRPGVVERECYIANPERNVNEPRFKHDIIFVGSKRYHPEYPYRPQLIDWLHNTYSERFAHYGGDGRGVVRGSLLNNLFAQAKVVVGDSLCINFDYPFYTSDRIYESTGRAAMIIHPRIKGLEEEFVDGKEVVFYDYGNFDQLKGLIDYYIENDEEREAIRVAGHERTKREHTYTNRLKEIFNILETETTK